MFASGIASKRANTKEECLSKRINVVPMLTEYPFVEKMEQGSIFDYLARSLLSVLYRVTKDCYEG